MINLDLKRSLDHFKRHEELGYRKLNFIHKVFLSMAFFMLLPSISINVFFKTNKKNRKQTFILMDKTKEPYTTIYKLLKQVEAFNFLQLNNLFIPVLPLVFIKDIGIAFKTRPIYMLKNLYFLGALSIKVSKYYFIVKYHKVSNLIVFQEYSFYMSYFTRIMEFEGGNLYNIQHGVPGDTYCHFRFSKCFVWSEYYKGIYINNKAEKTQFIVSGSIVHNHIKKKLKQKEEDIDILYIMQGKSEDMEDVLGILENLAENKVVRYIQHPRHPVQMKGTLIESEDNALDAILRSKVIISHYSTALLDACVLEKYVLSYIKGEKKLSRYVSYLRSDNIVHTKEDLVNKIVQQYNQITTLDEKYIANDVNPIQIIQKSIEH